jgi:hypothetical protein
LEELDRQIELDAIAKAKEDAEKERAQGCNFFF